MADHYRYEPLSEPVHVWVCDYPCALRYRITRLRRGKPTKRMTGPPCPQCRVRMRRSLAHFSRHPLTASSSPDTSKARRMA
jgi:hypothetical protein